MTTHKTAARQRGSHILDMTQGSPARMLLSFAVPVILANMLQQLYNLADTSIAGHMLGDVALAQIGATSTLYALVISFALGLTNGMALSVSRELGNGNETGMRRAVCWTTLLSMGTALVLTALFLALRAPLLRVLQTPEEILDGALAYITVIFIGIPLTVAYNAESSLLRSVGNSVTPLLFLLAACILNIFLDILFIGPFGLGVAGAAAATVLSQGVSAGLGLFYIARNYPELRFGRPELKVGAAFVWDVLYGGLSMAMMSTVFNIGSVILQSAVNSLGSVYIAAQVAGRRFMELFALPGNSLAISVATFTSQNYGAGKRSRILKGFKSAYGMYLCWWCVSLMFAIFLAPAAVRAMTGSTDETVLKNAVYYIRFSIPVFPPLGCLVIMRNVLQGMEHRIAPVLCSVVELIGKILFSFLLVPRIGYQAVCACEPVTWVVCCGFILAAAFRIRGEFREGT